MGRRAGAAPWSLVARAQGQPSPARLSLSEGLFLRSRLLCFACLCAPCSAEPPALLPPPRRAGFFTCLTVTPEVICWPAEASFISCVYTALKRAITFPLAN